MRLNLSNLAEEINSLKARVTKLEAEEAREEKERTIRPRSGERPFSERRR